VSWSISTCPSVSSKLFFKFRGFLEIESAFFKALIKKGWLILPTEAMNGEKKAELEESNKFGRCER
jgi:hypothetical protein